MPEGTRLPLLDDSGQPPAIQPPACAAAAGSRCRSRPRRRAALSGFRAVAVAALVATPAGAQTGDSRAKPPSPPEKERPAETIVVTGARTALPVTALPLTVDTLGGEDLQRQVAVSGSIVDAVSARLPAFSPTREKLTGMGETLRGRSPLFAINGVPQSTPIRDGSRDAYTIDPFFIDRVEVIYGSNALQGIGGTGGVVNQVTVGAPASGGVAGRTLFQATAADRLEGAALGGKAAALAAWREGRWDATLGYAVESRGVFLDAAGRRIGTDGAQGDVQDSRSWSLFGRAGYRISGSARLELVASRFELNGRGRYVPLAGSRTAGIPTSSVRGSTPGEPAANRAELLSLSFTNDAFQGGNLTAQLFFSRTRDIFGGGIFAMFQDPALDPTRRLFDQSVNRSRKLGWKVSYERSMPGLERLILTGGVDGLDDRTAQTLLATGRQWVPQTDFTSVAPFAQANLKLLDGRLRLAGGLRFENVRLRVPDFTTLPFYGARAVEGGTPSFSRLLKNGGIVLAPLPGLRAYAAYSEGYTIADVGRILRAITQPGVRIDPFLELRPVVSDNREIGVEWKAGRLDARAAYYWSSSKLGSLLVRNAEGFFDVLRQPIEIEGLEAKVEWRTPLPGLSIGGAYARVKGGTDTDDDGRIDAGLDGANLSPNRLNLYVELVRGAFDLRATARAYQNRDFPGQDPRNGFSGYTLLDADMGYRFGRHRLSLSVQNLTDRQYITYYSDTQGPDDNLRYFAGRGRTLTVALMSRW